MTDTSVDASSGSNAATGGDASLAALDPSALRVTDGAIERLGPTEFETSSGAMRAQLKDNDASIAEMRFAYHGPTANDVPLASGELRRQIGIKLRALDSCNVVYVMWRIEPSRGLTISVKSNPEQHKSTECGDSGYATLKPEVAMDVATIDVGSTHTLRAGIVGQRLSVVADGVLSWEGSLPDSAFEIDGPLGVRTDNGIFDVELRVGNAVSP